MNRQSKTDGSTSFGFGRLAQDTEIGKVVLSCYRDRVASHATIGVDRFVVDDRVSVLEELDSAIEIFLNTVDKKKMEDQEQGW